MPKYAFKNLNEEMVKHMIERTEGICDLAVLDWKGIKGHERKNLLGILQTYDIEIIHV
jgi:D-tyrosyl-tRNA(Tyr) deacylase